MCLLLYFILAKRPRSDSAIIGCHICLKIVICRKCLYKYIKLNVIIKMNWIVTSHFPSDGICFLVWGKSLISFFVNCLNLRGERIARLGEGQRFARLACH